MLRDSFCLRTIFSEGKINAQGFFLLKDKFC